MERLHISVFGPRNAGKSSLINALVGQEVSIVSDVPGTTTDPVAKPMELYPLGPVMITDTAGYDDTGKLGDMRVTRTKKILHKTDIALFVLHSDISESSLSEAKDWWNLVTSLARKVLLVINVKSDENLTDKCKIINEKLNANALLVNAASSLGVNELKSAMQKLEGESITNLSIVSHLVKPEDIVLLVMPQDLQAPKGRLILPQVQTIRDLLDNKCVVVSCTSENYLVALNSLIAPPALIITDSQVFPEVYKNKPQDSLLTSFSVLMARMKGDIDEFVAGAKALAQLNQNSRVLIAEACTHAPLAEDIGREKIPAMLRKRFGENIKIDIVAGNDWVDSLCEYDMIIHCGACMFNRKLVESRQSLAKNAYVPMTNYGVFIAAFNNIIDKIVY